MELTKNERLVLSVLTKEFQTRDSIQNRLAVVGLNLSKVEQQLILNKLNDYGYLLENTDGWAKKPTPIKNAFLFAALVLFGLCIISGPLAVIVWIWTYNPIATQYAATYGVLMLSVVWFGYLSKWAEMMQKTDSDV
jgi:hypothetical protein